VKEAAAISIVMEFIEGITLHDFIKKQFKDFPIKNDGLDV
jgi:hypothetical protein